MARVWAVGQVVGLLLNKLAKAWLEAKDSEPVFVALGRIEAESSALTRPSQTHYCLFRANDAAIMQ
jgi:hypothetical protein